MNVVKYIQNQKEHHKKISFVEEYQKFLQLFEVDFDERYIFKQPSSIFEDKFLGRWIQCFFVVEKSCVFKEFAPKGA